MMTMMSAAMPLMAFVLMVIAVHLGIVPKISFQQCLYCVIGTAAYSAVKRDPYLRKRCLRTAANAAADERIHAVFLQKTSQRAMSAAIGIHYLLLRNGSIFYLINFKLLCMPEMLKYRAIFIRDCYLHFLFSLLRHGLL